MVDVRPALTLVFNVSIPVFYFITYHIIHEIEGIHHNRVFSTSPSLLKNNRVNESVF